MKQKRMKRIGFIYEKIISVNNCKMAIINASDHKRKRENVIKILNNIDYYAEELSTRLQEKNFVTKYTSRTVTDRSSGKKRELQIPAFFPDQCAHHAIVQILQPIVMKSSYYWSCANIPGRGLDHACKGVERATVKDRRHAKYCVKMDIRKFYPSVPHDVLKNRLRERIKDEKAIELISCVIDSTEHGLPIGNYTSPWLAELFLQPMDWMIKQKLGVLHYVRYADDMVLIGNNKRELRKALYAVKEYVESLGMELKGDYQLFRIYKNGKGRKIDFVGRCFGIGFATIRKRRALALMRQSRLIRKMERTGRKIPFRMAAGFMSRSACFRRTNSAGLKKKYYDTVNIEKLKEVIRDESKRQLTPRSA